MIKAMSKERKLVIGAWGLSAAVAALALISWGQSMEWEFKKISTYDFFPLLGLLAFSLMWSHYIMSATRLHLRIDRKVLRQYFEWTSWAVLVLIIFHPGLLIWQLWRDGFGLPPTSYLENYVSQGLRWAAVLGSISLFIFLAYELRRFYGKRPWWRFVQYASDAAIIAIFFHGLLLGNETDEGWYRILWYFYGVTLIFSILYIIFLKKRASEEKTPVS
jgi:hypothetical protein